MPMNYDEIFKNFQQLADDKQNFFITVKKNKFDVNLTEIMGSFTDIETRKLFVNFQKVLRKADKYYINAVL